MKYSKIVGALVGILLFIALISGFTYALITWNTKNITINGNSDSFDVEFTRSPNISNKDLLLLNSSNYDMKNNTIKILDGMAVSAIKANVKSGSKVSNARLDISLDVKNLSQTYISGSNMNTLHYYVLSYNPVSITNPTMGNLVGRNFTILKSNIINSKLTNHILLSDTISTTPKGYLVVFLNDMASATNDIKDAVFSATLKAVVTQVN